MLDLARSIEASVDANPRLKQKLWKNLAKALGADFSDKLDKLFDPMFADRGFALYSMSDIPRPDEPTDSRITGLRFVSDLTAVSSSLSDVPLLSLRRILSTAKHG